ncbi:energy transducer TonB [Methylobacterium sp. Leaf108]|uniref:energy transducer TonB family protein n=1 Tax=Methylobacterium sp. Leaf108 TaxID=1736256 RepID=UPI0006F6E0E8|nr:energy transducer TonB [Methylobacterium sp. Leaf108]KQP51734.1 hypothetical protein ASF39_08130 [Methylobacterium sp. Leaf108]
MSLSTTADQPGGGPSGLGPAFLVAFLLHATALAGLAYYAPPPSAPPGENTITIDLAPQMTEADSQAPADQAQSDPPPAETEPVEAPDATVSSAPPDTMAIAPEDTTTAKPPAEATMAVPTEVEPAAPAESAAAAPPQEQVVTSTAEEAAPIEAPPEVVAETPKPPEPPKVVAQPKPPEPQRPKPTPPDPAKLEAARQEAKREAKRIAEREARRKAEIEAKREARAKAARDAAREARDRSAEPNTARGAQNSASASRQSSAGAAAGGNDPSALRAWQGALSSAIHGRMDRNAAAGTAGGVAVVRFTVTRSGQVTSAGLARSSGVGPIDSAALATVRGSLPAAPAGVSVSSLAVTVPLRFSPGR